MAEITDSQVRNIAAILRRVGYPASASALESLLPEPTVQVGPWVLAYDSVSRGFEVRYPVGSVLVKLPGKIPAIRFVRTESGLCLRDAKAIVDKIAPPGVH
jgi:hypothetical protein